MLSENNPLLNGTLVCPLCKNPLRLYPGTGAGALHCTGARVHCFDLARSGYAPLSPRQNAGGDSREAVRARTSFLSAGYYQGAADTLCHLASTFLPQDGVLLDAGCGEGYYTNRLAKALGAHACVSGMDLSRDAVDAAAKAAKRENIPAFYAVASIFALPFADASTDMVVNVFAPCSETEFCRILKPGGILIVVGAGERHLMGLKHALYDTVYTNEARADLPQKMHLLACEQYNDTVTVTGQEQIAHLFSMTPYYWRTSPADREKLQGLDTLTTEISFTYHIYRKEPEKDNGN